MNPVGGRIRTIRAERLMTLPQLADKSGLSKGLLSKLENTNEPNPSLDTLQSVATALGITLSDLLDSERVQAKRFVPDKEPDWVRPLSDALQREGKQPDPDLLQALYVLQHRKGSAQRKGVDWLYMYRSLELSLNKASK